MTDDRNEILDTSLAGGMALRGSAIRVGGYVAGLGLALVSAPLLVRHLGTEGFGQYFTVISLMAIIAGVTEGGISVLATREFVTRSGVGRDRAMANLLGLRLILSVVGGLGALAFVVLAGYDRVVVVGTLVALGGLLLQVTQAMLAVPLQSALRNGWVAALELIRQAVTVLLIVLLVLIGTGVVSFLAMTIPAGALVLVWTIVLVRGVIPMRPRFDVARWGEMLRDVGAVGVAVALNALYFRVTIVLMSVIASEVDTGLFSIAFQVIAIAAVVPGLAVSVVFPVLSRSAMVDVDRLWVGTRRIVELAAVFGALLTVLILSGSRLIVEILAGRTATEAVPILQVLALAVFALFLTYAAGATFLSLKRYRLLVAANVGGLALSVTLTIVLVPGLGAIGAAVAAAAAEFVVAVASLLALWRAGVGRDLSWATIPLMLAVVGVSVAIPWALGLGSVVTPLVAITIAVVLVLVTGRFPPEVRELVVFRRSAGGGAG